MRVIPQGLAANYPEARWANPEALTEPCSLEELDEAAHIRPLYDR